MKNNLFFIVLALSPWVMANQDDVQIERIYTNQAVAQAPADAYDGVDNSGYGAYGENDNDSRNSKNSPQVNIYNANSNQNENDHKQTQEQDQDLDAKVSSAAEAESTIGQEYIARANDLRHARKNLEVGTEQKMIEKIEFSRMEDEKDRADRLFGNRLDKNYGYQQQQQQYQATSQPEYKEEQTKVIIVEKEKETEKKYEKEDDYESDAYVAEKSPISYGWWGQESYVAPILGTSSYTSSVNTSGNKALGVALGTRFESGWAAEASFIYSDYQVNQVDQCNFGGCPPTVDVTQYNLSVGAKYHFNIGMVSPFVGGLIGYTYRDYANDKNLGSEATDAFDAGLGVGADVKVAKNFSIGAEYRWMTNLTNSREDDPTGGITQATFANAPGTLGMPREKLEEIDYQMLLINGKFTF